MKPITFWLLLRGFDDVLDLCSDLLRIVGEERNELLLSVFDLGDVGLAAMAAMISVLYESSRTVLSPAHEYRTHNFERSDYLWKERRIIVVLLERVNDVRMSWDAKQLFEF